MNYSEEDIKQFGARGVEPSNIDKQLKDFEQGFNSIELIEPATVANSIISLNKEDEEDYIHHFEESKDAFSITKMVPASGSATRMFKDLYTFLDTYNDTYDDFLSFIQERGINSMNNFFEHLDEFAFYTHLAAYIHEKGLDINKMLEKREYKEILSFILNKKGLNYGNTPKGLVDFHIYRDFARTPFDEHLVEGALYASSNGVAKIHFTVSPDHLADFKKRFKKTGKIFEKLFGVQYEVSFSIQEPSTDMVSVDKKGNIVRDENNAILFRPAGHGALLHNLNEIKEDIIFIKNIDNVVPDRFKGDTVRYKKVLAGILIENREKIFDMLRRLEQGMITNDEQEEIIDYIVEVLGIHISEKQLHESPLSTNEFLFQLLNRPIRVCGMVKNEGEPGGGPFFAKSNEGLIRPMIIESAQVNMKDKTQAKIFKAATHFNPVDIVCCIKNYKNEFFNLHEFVDTKQGFITNKSYQGNDIFVQELPGLWNGSMSNWNTIFVEVPETTFSPVKTVFDLLRIEHRNIIYKV